MEIYRAGYVGGAVEDALDWMADRTQDAKRICIPFTGIGRAMCAVQRPDTIIDSWDTMHYTKCIVDGVFNATEADSVVDGIHYRKGWMFENRTYKNIDDRSAGFIDWVCEEGTDFDKACIGSAMTRSTVMGRLTHWKSNVENLYVRYQKQAEYNQEWLKQPGIRNHHEGDFFKSDAFEMEFDVAVVDPPKVLNYSDIYSLHFNHFNQALTAGKADKLPRWTRRNSIGYFRQLMELKTNKIVFMYVSKVFPTYEDVKKVLSQYGTIEEEAEFYHNGRYDYGLVISK